MNKMAKDGLMQRAGRVLLLTGTPMLNRPIEIQPLLAALAPEEFGNFMSFAKRYADAHQKNIGRRLVWDFSGASRLEELQERMRATVMVRRLKKDVLKELPPKRRQVVILPTNGAAKAVAAEQAAWERHEQALADVRDEMDLAHAAGDDESYEAAARKLQQATKLAFEEISRQRHAVAVAKVPAVIEHVEGMLRRASRS
jgi:SWI/SNF-related matrix-associated actin-dependent regulator 1 of chromatin subfamily A